MALLALTVPRIYTPTRQIADGCVLVEDTRVLAVGVRGEVEVPAGARVCELGEGMVVPGFLDVHVHGAGGRDVMEGSVDALRTVGRTVRAHGTLAYLATTVSAPVEETLQALQALSRAIQLLQENGTGEEAVPVGIHLEGPFLNPARRGAHPAESLQAPSAALLRKMLEAAAGKVKMLTLAPELAGAGELIELAQAHGVLVALGHSDATYEEALAAIDKGARHVVHLFNAMRPFHHRDPGILVAALTDERVTGELVVDGVHAAPASIRLAVAAKNPERLLLVSDGTSATGMPDGRYRLGRGEVRVEQGVCRTPEGNLAGSALTLDRALRNLQAFTGASLAESLPMVSSRPARLVGLGARKGGIFPGADADLLWLDDDCRVRGTVRGGRVVFA